MPWRTHSQPSRAARAATLALGLAAPIATPGPVVAQEASLSAIILRGRATGPAVPGGGSETAILARGVRVNTPPGTWTEIAFANGASLVLEAGADFTLRGVERGPNFRLVIRGASGGGRLRVTAPDGVEIVLITPTAEVQVLSASAVLESGREGRVTLTAGRSVTVVRAGGGEEVIRRPGFSVAFADEGVRRRDRAQLAGAVAPFAPVEDNQAASPERIAPTEGTADATTGSRRLGPGRGRTDALAYPVASFARSPAGAGAGSGGAGGGTGSTPPVGPVGGTVPITPVVPTTPIVPTTPSTPTVPTPTPPTRTADRFDLARTTLASNATPGSTFAAPGINSGTSNLDTRSDFTQGPNSEYPAQSIVGIESQQRFGTGRVRRFTPEGTGTAANGAGGTAPRNDSGVVTSTVGGNTGTGTAGTFYSNLSSATLPRTLGQTFYDGIANVGTVTIQVWEPRTGGNGTGADYTSRPRFSVTDSVIPNITTGLAYLAYTLINGQRSYLRDNFGDIVYSFDAFSGGVPPGYVVENSATSPIAVGLYRGGSILESGVRPVGTLPNIGDNASTTVATAPNNGAVFRMSGDTGLAMYRGPALPDTRFTTFTDNGNISVVGDLGRNGTRTGTITNVAPDIYIIDKITAGTEALYTRRGIAAGERYFVIGGTPVANVNAGLPGLTAGRVTRFAVSDGLNPLGGFVEGASIEAQFRGPGRTDQPVAFNQYNAFRPEGTFVPGAARGDTHLLIIAGDADRNPAMRVDLQVAPGGASSAGVSVGGIARLPNGDRSLALSGNTVGIARLTPGEGASLIASNLGSLGTGTPTDATGYSGHLFPGSDRAPGQIGYFAVSQADTRRGSPEDPVNGPQPGSITGSGGTASSFGYTRLATNVGAPAGAAPRGALALQGYAAGIVEASSGAGAPTLYGVTTPSLGGVSIVSRNGARELDASFALAPRAAGDLSADPTAFPAPAGTINRALTFGGDGASGTTPTTAVASTATFAGVIPGRAAMTSVDSDLRAGIAGGEVLPPSNDHLAWGAFLGDLATEANGRREMVGLGFWVAGRPVDLDTLRTLTGTATYGGGMIGNVAQATGGGATLRTAVGSFTHAYDFGRRTGSFAANFDSAAFGLATGMPAGSTTFTGSGVAGDRTLSVQGTFFHNAATGGALSVANLPRATGGIFGVVGPGYGANGVFVGARP